MPWYKWEPGAIPYLDRISVEARGLLWIWMDDWWRGFPTGDPMGVSEATLSEATRVWPVILANLTALKDEAESNRKSRHYSAVNANRIRWGSGSDPDASECHPKPSQEGEVEGEVEKNNNTNPNSVGVTDVTESNTATVTTRKQRAKVVNTLLPISNGADQHARSVYTDMAAEYPKWDKGFKRGTTDWTERRVKGSSPQAEKNILGLVSGGIDIDDLYTCIRLAKSAWDKGHKEKEFQFVPDMSAFFGEKEHWAAFYEDAKEYREWMKRKAKNAAEAAGASQVKVPGE